MNNVTNIHKKYNLSMIIRKSDDTCFYEFISIANYGFNLMFTNTVIFLISNSILWKKKNNLSSLQWLLLNETYICFSAIFFFLILVHIIIISVVSVTCVLVFLLVVLVCWRISRSKLHTNEIRKLFCVVFIPTPLFYLMHHFRRLCLIYRNWYIL